MTISYPLSLPVATKVIQSIELRAINAVAYSRSPFTFSGQAFAYPGQMWTADVTLKPMKRADAEQWVAWLISLRGQLGTFLLGDPNGVTPRGSALGGRVNLLTYSEQFDNAAWGKTNATVTANSSIAPDGAMTADTVVFSSGVTGIVFQSITPLASTSYSCSFYIKGTAGQTLTPYSETTSGTYTFATPGTVTLTGSWQRVSWVHTTSVGNTVLYPVIRSQSADTAKTVYVWGAQLEIGSVATTYQPIFNAYGPYVNGASQTGGSLVIDGASPDETGYLLAGDYIQLGTNGSSRLHKVLTNVNTDSSGNATLDIWPHIRVAPADNATVTVSNAKGLFRLSSNEQAWSVNEAAIYGITFSAMEAV